MSDINPLLELPFQIPFTAIEAAHVEPAMQALLARAEERLEAIAAPHVVRTWANTMAALDMMSEDLDVAFGVVRHLEATATSPELREAFGKIEPLVMAFYARVPLHEGLWRAVQEYAATEEAKGLTGVRKRYLEKTIQNFLRSGAGLSPEDKKKMEAIDVELAELTTKFSQNVLDATNEFEHVVTDEGLLKGLPPSAVDAARESAKAKGLEGWRFTLQAPSYTPVLTYLDHAATREKFYRAYMSRCSGGSQSPEGSQGSGVERDNRALVVKILELRMRKASMLGFADFSDLALEDRMAGKGERAWQFLLDLRAKTERFFERENADLLAFRRELEGAAAPALQPWDVSYYAEKLRQARYDFDEEQLRPYFPMERVLAGMYGLVEKLYGVTVERDETVAGWDPAVLYYRLKDSDGTFLGGFYADWYPRENKRGGAWMDAFRTGGPTTAGFVPHLGLMCGNMNPPVGGKPALLTHRDVETVFHEFGHLLHHLLSKVELRGLAGTNVAWDFVELPSQIMENWCWEREALDLFARHYETGEALPEELFQKMKAARTFRAANGQMRQLSFGVTDLALHRSYDAARDGDVVAYSKAILQQYSAAPLPDDHAMIAGFTHLFASPVGYAAGYYSYKWAEVLDADAFSLFREKGVFSREAGMKFRSMILERGDSEDPAQLFRSLMGRDPDPAALLERAGLVG
ncbi:MAG: M3 family metallopeptidase [Acidobacteria bacterium]|nr:M3 family metallopeptidase [Acidobacteriota bacterium]